MLWIALHLPALSLESWAATRDAAQAGRPMALLQDHQVQHADALALARGVRPGMKRSTALALAPDLLQAASDLQRDALALRAVVHVALGFSPAVAWATPPELRATGEFADAQPAPHAGLVGVRLEVQSTLRYFGGLPALLGRLRAALAPLGHRLRIACAPTALGAALLAAWAEALGDQVDPERWTLGPHSTGPEPRRALQLLLDALPLPLLGSGQAHAPALQGMGLHTLADLRPLPRSGLARRFGPALLDDIDRARGHAPEAHAWLSLPAQFASRIELLCRADTSAQVLAGAQLLLARLVAWAGASQSRIARFTLVMHHEPSRRDTDTPTQTRLDIAPAEPAADAGHLLALLTERLGRLPLPAPALELSLQCQHRVAGAAPNGELFASRASERAGLARLVERLQARLGPQQVQCLAPVADHRPECAPAGKPLTRRAWARRPRPRPGSAWVSRPRNWRPSRCGCCPSPGPWSSATRACGWTARPCNCWPAPNGWKPAGGRPMAWRCATTSPPSCPRVRWYGSTATGCPTPVARRPGTCMVCLPDGCALLSSPFLGCSKAGHDRQYRQEPRDPLPALRLPAAARRPLGMPAALRHNLSHLLDGCGLPGLRPAVAQDPMPGLRRVVAPRRLVPRAKDRPPGRNRAPARTQPPLRPPAQAPAGKRIGRWQPPAAPLACCPGRARRRAPADQPATGLALTRLPLTVPLFSALSAASAMSRSTAT